MAIRIARNDAGNCINFFGTSNPTYWNACLEGEINEDNSNNVNVINKVRTIEEGTTIYEFFNRPYTLFVDKDENVFESASECAEYITDNANVLSDTGTFVFSQSDLLDAQRESTNTTVLFSNGDIYAVNSLQAVAQNDGTITVRTIRGDKDIYQRLRYYNVSVNDNAINSFNTINAAVDRLNEVLSGGTITSDTGSATSEESTESASATFTVYGDRITETGSGATLGYTSTAEAGNFDTSNGFYSNETINEAGEYYEFTQDGGDWTNATGLTFGLFDETTYDVADLDEDLAGNAVKAVLRLRLKNTPFVFKDPASTYGRLNEAGFSSSVNTVAQWRVGLDAERRPYIAAYINSAWTTVCRTETATPVDQEFRFVGIMPLANELEGIRNMTVNTLVEAPALTWYYIESPDGSFDYPLFTDSIQANYVDEEYGTAADGAGASHTHTYVDESPTSQTWYMPSTYMFHDQTSAPTPPTGVVYNEIATGDDANYVPTSFGTQTLTVDEGDSINYAIKPADDASTYNVTSIPAGLAYNATTGNLTGTAPDVLQDNVQNPSDEYTITVTKSNDFGSSTGTLTLTINNLTVPSTAITGFTYVSGSTTLVDSDTLNDGTAVSVDDLLGDARRFVANYVQVRDQVIPALTATNDTVYIGIPKSTASWGSIEDADWDVAWKFQYASATSIAVSMVTNGTASSATTQSHNATDGTNFNYYIDNEGGVVELLGKQAGQGGNTEPSVALGGTWTLSASRDTGATGNKTVHFAAVNTTMDLSVTGLNEVDTPAGGITTSWTKALDFSGSNEHVKQVSSHASYNPLRMNGLSTQVPVNATSSKSSSNTSARPWATTIVFKADRNNSNQHIWNSGEGTATGNDNIYLRLSATGDLFFGWGREGSGYNECRIAQNISSSTWYGVYVGHKGYRASAAAATASNLSLGFDIRLMSSADSFASVSANLSTSSNWTSTGARMDRAVTGDFTIAGRGTNRNFHGKVASMVITNLRANFTMPDATEIKMMITDPKKWEDDYRDGQLVRAFSSTSESTYNANDWQYGYTSNYIWLMGDGTGDTYFNHIRNQVLWTDQNVGKLQLNSMVSNDIQNVTIPGLS